MLTSLDEDAVLFVIVAKQSCCLVNHLVSEVLGLCLSVFVTSDQRMLNVYIHLFPCVD